MVFVNIIVFDINDNVFWFDKFIYLVEVREDSEVNMVVIVVYVVDDDEGLVGVIIYFIIGWNKFKKFYFSFVFDY